LNTGAVASGDPTAGNINFGADVSIAYGGAAERTFRLEAHRDISSFATEGKPQINATGKGALNVEFIANANGSEQGGHITFNGNSNTNGGNVVMEATAPTGA